ncbi:uncharacterized protein [Spinacia oleracea]|uniref:Retrotransposon Copia-like N-terminal domain-containing protein n=1 Tax=Spinacia oleracea TaxID=3562 RepID=A0A9R0J1U4_SPIOL|nr:uncharacterized protein LOC110798906 [Spinacia oleracea]
MLIGYDSIAARADAKDPEPVILVDSSIFLQNPKFHSAIWRQLVSVKFKGEGESYGDWRRSMMISMSSKNKLGFVNGTINKPEITDATYPAWMRCNDMMISWLLFNLESNIAKSVMYFNTAREIWLDLEDRFEYVNGPQLFALEQQASEVTQGTQSISDFFTEIKSVWDKLSVANPLPSCTCNMCTCNLTQKIAKMQHDHRLMQFLMKLSEHLANARGNLLMMQPLPTISLAYRMLAQEEKQRELSMPSIQHHDSHAFAADRRRYNDFNNRGNYRGPQQTYGRNNYSYNNRTPAYRRPTSSYFCDHCKVNGHSTERCFKLHGFPPGFQGFKNDKKWQQQLTQKKVIVMI